MVLKNKSEYLVDDSPEELTRQLNPKDFCQINGKYFLKIESIANLHIYSKSDLKLELSPLPEEEVFVSIDKVTTFEKRLDIK